MTTRRRALAAYGSLLAGSSVLRAQQQLVGEPPGRFTPVAELVNAFEFEPMAQRRLDAATYAEIAGGDRQVFDRITFMPNMMVNTSKLDLSVKLFGESSYTPILVGPTAQQKRYHPEGELAMVRGASAARAFMVVSSRSSFPIEQIAAESKTTLWYQTFAEADARTRVDQAVKLGCKAVCLTLDGSIDWSVIDSLRKGVTVPFLLKGILSPDEAHAAVEKGIQGIVVSAYSTRPLTGVAHPMEVLPAIADAVGGKATILVDGSFRRGSDVLKALALGAHAVLLGRPALWGLASYGADGVQTLLQLIQSETARILAQCGRPNLAAIDRTMVRVHRR